MGTITIYSTTVNQAPKRLQPWIGKDLNLSGEYTKKGGKVKILRSDFCTTVIKHYALEGNEIAEYSLEKFADIGMRSWIQNITGWQPQQNQALEQWQIARLASKQTRRCLTDAIKAYIDRHPELSENNRKWLYVNASQRVTLVVFGRKAKKLAEDLGVATDNLRDALTPDELILLQEVEDTAIRLIDIQDMHPDDAIKQSAERLLIQVQTRALSLK
ncbi:MAG: hypothetical protein ACM37W_19915 [Actinomycetota bacterium]